MSTEIRLWLGWRTAAYMTEAAGWKRFTDHLAQTFVPATWEVMSDFGLRAYVPSIFSPSEPPYLPDEVALLVYESKAKYAESKSMVRGRGYSVMHAALFDFTTPGRGSKSDWAVADAVAGGTSPTLRLTAPGDPGFDDPAALVHVLLLRSSGTLTATKVLDALSGIPGQLAVWCQPGFAVVWIATRQPLDEATLTQALPAKAQVVAFHRARPAPPIEQKTGVPPGDRLSWHFCH